MEILIAGLVLVCTSLLPVRDLLMKVSDPARVSAGGGVAVSALRQASIPISVVLSGLYLNECSAAKRFYRAVVLAVEVVVTILSR